MTRDSQKLRVNGDFDARILKRKKKKIRLNKYKHQFIVLNFINKIVFRNILG